MSKTRKTALITGASKGLGRALAIEAAAIGFDLILVSLPQSGTYLLADQIEQTYDVSVKVFEIDLLDAESIDLLASYTDQLPSLEMLINNAGCGGSGAFETASVAYIDKVLQLNVITMTLLTRKLIPALMRSSKRSYVMNISSIAAFAPIGYKHVYPASKAFVYAFTLGLREEYRNAGVSFSTVHPGPMLTNSDSCRRIVKQGNIARFCLESTTKVAQTSLQATLKGKAVIIPGLGNKLTYLFMKLLPSGIVKKLITQGVKKEIDIENEPIKGNWNAQTIPT
ncbi:SDR family NAD(P)-dependent oxidoreductase [Belliella sp. DSM 111904]|uniref:SDR family NAD(P)-dependent oxidoreductase n=1 Tax=Belliella filtrata TaxID=2923435 RepID=A0ABS9UYV6_9BACT|nr:SDR family NAD(P)-dependent oxidoreductase [Belliella filtrata]MCH7408938.1 SDR family NAD(P)-dependent oxidoreductase [Belliella filtrata]